MKNPLSVFALLVWLLALNSCNPHPVLPNRFSYKTQMRNFVHRIGEYARRINPNFIIIPQNGAELVSRTGDDTGSPDIGYISDIDGMGQEDLYYGYDNDDQATPPDATDWTSFFLDMAKDNLQVKILVTDYCSTHSKMDDSYATNNARGYISFAADHRELDNIPDYPATIYNENDKEILSLRDAANFLYLINPDVEYATSQDFVDAVKNTNYDIIIMDFFFDGQTYTPAQIDELKQKANGGKRLIISYMSIGQAEDYRYYWNPDWNNNPPEWLDSEDPNWPGNYYVKYWYSEWNAIIYGSSGMYLDRIIDAGFDGVYLDIIDGFEHFE